MINREEEVKSLEDIINKNKELIYKFAYKRALKHFEIHKRYSDGVISKDELNNELERLIDRYESQQEKNSKIVRQLELKKLIIEEGSEDLVNYILDEGELSDNLREEFYAFKKEYFKRPFISLLITYGLENLMMWTFKVEDFNEYVTENGITDKGNELLKQHFNTEELYERICKDFGKKLV